MTHVSTAFAAKGDVPFERLYREHRTRLGALVARRCGGGGFECEDVVHEAFARFMAAYGGRPLDNPVGLLYRIAVNIIRDTVRSDSFRRRQLENSVEPPCHAPAEPDPEQAIVSRHRLRALQKAVSQLPPRCREVFLLHKVEGLSHTQVAATLGISRSMVEKHMIRAYSYLQAADAEQRY
ncbi:MAG TPA: RNA polymerase sigma factor [Magnetospirillum sp.]|nr:RNA polymerase sigma factor [Magnetospirillum sp.]